MHAATEVIGMMASLTSFLTWLPQGARVWRNRRNPAALGGIVLSTQVISLAGCILWGTYALLIDSFWLGAPSLVNGPIAIGTLVVVRRAQRSERLRLEAEEAVTRAAEEIVTGAIPVVPAARVRPSAGVSTDTRELALV